MGSKLLAAEQSTFMIDLHQVGMMLRYTKMWVARYLQKLIKKKSSKKELQTTKQVGCGL